MTNVKKILLAATALTMAAGTAQAGGNQAYTLQQGNNAGGNQLRIFQDQTDRSEVGTSSNPVFQNGSRNILFIDQDGRDNKVAAANGDFQQDGTDNNARIEQFGVRNNTSTVYQQSYGNGSNQLNVLQDGTDGLIGSATQINNTPGGQNVATLTQTGSSRFSEIRTTRQEGNDNALSITQTDGRGNLVISATQYAPSEGDGNGMTITQSGNRNVVASASQESLGGGRNNTTLSFLGNDNGNLANSGGSFDIPGFANGMQGFNDVGNGNSTLQRGNGNSLTASFDGDQNRFGFTQRGNNNKIFSTVDGNRNEVAVYQQDDSQFAQISITGDRNQVGIAQYGFNNEAYAVVGSDGNTSVMTQSGTGNYAYVQQ